MGIAIVLLLPPHAINSELAALLIPLTLVIRNYPVSFACRCMLIVIAAGSLSESELSAEIRMISVFAGGLVGVICAHLSLCLTRLTEIRN